MERLTNKREADAQREGYERRLANGYQRSIPVERFLRLAAYEDSELEPEEVSALIKDWSDLRTIIGECGGLDRLRELAKADKDGRLVVHGQWIPSESDFDDDDTLFDVEEWCDWQCSACREDICYDDPMPMRLLPKYCPNCGTDMRGSNDE